LRCANYGSSKRKGWAMTQEQQAQVQALFATLANVDRIDNSGDPNTLSLDEIRKIGGEGLDLVDALETTD